MSDIPKRIHSLIFKDRGIHGKDAFISIAKKKRAYPFQVRIAITSGSVIVPFRHNFNVRIGEHWPGTALPRAIAPI